MSKIPDRWVPYKACGKIIEGTRFICFKVPLKKNVQAGIQNIKEIWDIPALLKKIPKLGVVIDLTNTARYYNPEELQAAGVLHKKILVPGRTMPPESKVTEFMDAVDAFLGKDCVADQVKRAHLGLSTTDFLIGVHCTHGLNRTGYMVCRYMRDRLGVPAKDAIKKFEKARGYEIERENYIADLLGKKPLPPDEGVDTVIKPTVNKMKIPYSRSVVNDEEEAEDITYTRVYNRFNRDNYNKDGKKFDRHKRISDENWRIKNAEQSGSDSRNTDRSKRRKSSSYDYRYDY